MMIHSPHKGTVISEYSLDLGGVLKLKFLVNVPTVLYRSPLLNVSVERRTIGPELRSQLHLTEEEIPRMVSLGRYATQHIEGELPCSFLLCHEKGSTSEVCFVHLHNTL